VADIKTLETRSDKAANALVIGLVGRGRYVILTDYLIDRFAEDEVDAVVAHELGHARKHHLLLKLGAWFATLLVLGALNVAIIALGGEVDPVWFVHRFPIGLLVGLLITQGVLGLVLERRADRFGAELVGKDAMVRALERLAEANMAKRRTGFLWNLLTQHPGIERRVKDLRSSVTPDPNAGARMEDRRAS
jgi:Zn-dependent protease with chaperone function